MNIKIQDRIFILTFLLPPILIYTVFVVYPILSGLATSFYQWRGTGDKTWIGFENYIKLLSDENFINSLVNTIKYSVVQVPIILFLGLLFAILISGSSGSKWINFYRSSIFMPFVLPGVAIALLWSTIFNPISGLLNLVLESVGLGALAHEWLGDPTTAFWAIVWVKTWATVGFYTLLLIAGISNIPKEVLEAADIDGASRWQKSARIIIPMLSPVVKVVVIFLILNSLKMFEEPQLMTGGGPNRATEPVSLYMYEQAFSNFNFGYASAIGVVFFVLTFIFSIFTIKTMGGDD
ncbi:carbohydrate ABC transporter permease [Radiobacillus sp. PE A8.2]|uniref:carbohydrate ABC transporter permease n=1 Tax=Radiobacillus sp. PE A8.2 TaxID=3380349 RepID=UPI00388DC9C3